MNLALIVISTSKLPYKPLQPFLQSVPYFPDWETGIIVLRCFVNVLWGSERESRAGYIMYFLENIVMAKKPPLYVYRKWQVTLLALRILCLCHLSRVFSIAGIIPNRCFLLLIFLFFLLHHSLMFSSKALIAKLFLEWLFFIWY